MDRTLSVRTPESIAFSFELAGIGSRFLAVAVDMFLQIAILAAIFFGLSLAGSHGLGRGTHAPKAIASLAVALIATVVFLVFFGYFIAFETFWQGRTPGKRLLGLRVVRDGGYPLDFASAAIRNLVRVGEFAFGFYAISAVAALISPENKRLGDLAAGTIVVRDAAAAAVATIVAETGARPAMLSGDERALIDRFVARRTQLAPQHRARLASEIAALVRPRVSRDLQGLPDDELLTRLSAS